MGTIVRFPEGRRPASGGRHVGAGAEPAPVIILPVVRIEREPDKPLDGRGSGSAASSGRRKRRRATRS